MVQRDTVYHAGSQREDIPEVNKILQSFPTRARPRMHVHSPAPDRKNRIPMNRPPVFRIEWM